jgi:hypothetical protein
MTAILLPALLLPALSTQDSALSTFSVQTAGGQTHTGPLQEIGEDWSIRLGGDEPRRVAGTFVLMLRRLDRPLPARPTGEQLVLANGDQVPGQVQKLTGEVLHFRAGVGAGADWKLPLSALSLIWVAAPYGTDHADRLRRRLLAGKRGRDVVLLRNGDVLEGLLTGLDRDSVRVEVDKRPVAVGFAKLAVIALNTDLVRFPKPKAAYAHAVLANGARLALASARADGQTFTGKTPTGTEVRFPVADLIALDLYQAKAVYLSDLKPARYEYTPYLDEHWPYVADGNVAGRDLRLGGGTYDKGLGMHSQSRLTYDLSAGYQHFEALVGLDDETGREGSVVVRVLVDGKPQDAKEMTGRGAPRPLRVNVAGARELTLVVEFGRGGHVQDHVNWADARLIQ